MFLGWIDGDPAHEAAVLKALGAAGQNDARDELGLGGVRDSFADTFFPGLSTIQTRLRYFLFVQWICEAAASRGSPEQILAALHRQEVDLIRALTPLGQGKGVIGIDSQERLARMPSDIYWAGLHRLGQRQVDGSPSYWARRVVAVRSAERLTPANEGEGPRGEFTGFDPDRPAPPAGFPNVRGLTFELTSDEIRFLRRRLSEACIESAGQLHRHNLMAPFSNHRSPLPWGMEVMDHPCIGQLAVETRALLSLASAFAEVMLGAAMLYRRNVAELKFSDGHPPDLFERASADYQLWVDRLKFTDVQEILANVPEIQKLGLATRHKIRWDAITFIKSWANLCRDPDQLSGSEAIKLVSKREMALKRKFGTSRIVSAAARSRWLGGAPGRLDYRWNTARRYLNDLAGVP